MRAAMFIGRLTSGVARAYRLVCAREDVRRQGLRTPLGVWFCERCRLVIFDRLVWNRHVACCIA